MDNIFFLSFLSKKCNILRSLLACGTQLLKILLNNFIFFFMFVHKENY